MLQLQHEEIHTLSSTLLESTLVGHKDLEVAERNNMVKVDCLDLESSRGCPIRHLALQQTNMLPMVMLTYEHEGEFYKSDKVSLSQSDNVPMLESFTLFLELGRYSMQQYAFHIS